MIKNNYLLDRFEREQIKKEKYSYQQALKIFEMLYQEARNLGIIQLMPVLEGIEKDVKLAKALSGLK